MLANLGRAEATGRNHLVPVMAVGLVLQTKRNETRVSSKTSRGMGRSERQRTYMHRTSAWRQDRRCCWTNSTRTLFRNRASLGVGTNKIENEIKSETVWSQSSRRGGKGGVGRRLVSHGPRCVLCRSWEIKRELRFSSIGEMAKIVCFYLSLWSRVFLIQKK